MGSQQSPSDKALRKRPMTAEQLALEYLKMPRAGLGYDSDEDAPEQPRGTPMHARHARQTGVANIENIPPITPLSEDAQTHTVYFRDGGGESPATLEREWARDIEAVMRREHEGLLDDEIYDVPETVPTGEEIVGDALYEEQNYRHMTGLPLLVQSSLNADHWVEPQLPQPIVAVPNAEALERDLVTNAVLGSEGKTPRESGEC